MPLPVFAAPSSITYTFGHHLISVSVSKHPEWRRMKKIWYFQGLEAVPPARLQTCGEEKLQEPGWTSEAIQQWDSASIERTIGELVASKVDRPAGRVTISKTASGTVTFDGQGLTGQRVDTVVATRLTIRALSDDVSTVVLPVHITQPAIDVRDEELGKLGIKEVVTIGESVFSGSPVNRRHNIGVGVARFNGHLIPQGSVFSFDETLGPVNATTGYRKELVIQGDTTIPDYGGGLCQVSTTAFRGPWEYGMPILQRRNHSYAVSYYSPQGTDATVYPPNVDIKFRNDTPGALLLQTFVDDQSRAFFIYYGTRDDRKSEVFGPYISDRQSAPKTEKIIYTKDLPPGEKRKAGERHDGMKAAWYRSVQMAGTGVIIEPFFSAYQARPFTWQIGIAAGDTGNMSGDGDKPSWLPDSTEANRSSSASSEGGQG
jgi:vancomycin resistance protein YoaR